METALGVPRGSRKKHEMMGSGCGILQLGARSIQSSNPLQRKTGQRIRFARLDPESFFHFIPKNHQKSIGQFGNILLNREYLLVVDTTSRTSAAFFCPGRKTNPAFWRPTDKSFLEKGTKYRCSVPLRPGLHHGCGARKDNEQCVARGATEGHIINNFINNPSYNPSCIRLSSCCVRVDCISFNIAMNRSCEPQISDQKGDQEDRFNYSQISGVQPC